MSSFVHLHNHTAYSLLDGAAKIEAEVARAKELEQPALAITDHGVMYGAVDFYKACEKAGIKPIIGCEVYVAPGSRFDRRIGIDDRPYHLVLLCKNETGYRNLCKLVTFSYTEGFYRRPRVDRELLAKYHDGLIALSACLGGELPRKIASDNLTAARETAAWYQSTFGEGNYYLEMQNHGTEEEAKVNRGLRLISKETGIPLVATNDNHYVYKEDSKMQDVMLCIQTGSTLADADRMQFYGEEFYLKSYEEMLEAFPGEEEALANTVKIAEQCEFEFNFNENHLPEFIPPEGETLRSYLHQLTLKGLHERYENPTEEAFERLEKELNIINDMGYNAYFLIVWDFVDFAKRQGIYVGPGRGSAAGSLVSYTLGITDVDPLRHQLLFERFLNPERVNMPDIDIDFCYERRNEVIDYVTEKYGSDHVSQIITFGTLAAKAAIRDVGRVMGVPISTVNAVCKAVPQDLGITLSEAIAKSSELRQMMQEDATIKELMQVAQKLEGLPRHAGTHAAGVVISEAPLDEYLPLQKTNDDAIITQYEKDNVEAIGLLKMDFLGLRTLTVVNKALEYIKRRTGEEIDLDQIDEADPKTFAMLSEGDSIGVFQMESSGLRAVLKDLKPTNLDDLIALVALYRPGPLGSGMVEEFIACKHGERENTFLHPMLEPILSPTYGVILYQEQVMQIASVMGGFSLGEADLLRRAMGKKNPDIIKGLEDQFIEGALARNVDESVARRVFELIGHFAGYGFNKSHSAAYGQLALETAYLKAHYPKEFMAELMNAFIDNKDKVSFYIDECRRMKIDILPPDVNESGDGFTVTDEGIRFGLSAIKGVGHYPAKAIMEGRKDKPYQSFQDFIFRVSTKDGLNKRALESLIKSGAFEAFGVERRRLYLILDEAMAQANSTQKARSANQVSFFDILDPEDAKSMHDFDIPEAPPFSQREILNFEKELLGVYVSGHPLEAYTNSLKRHTSHEIHDLTEDDHDKRMVLGGMLLNVRQQSTKRGELMAYADLEGLHDTIGVLVFPKKLDDLRHQLIEGTPVTIRGRVSIEEDEKKIFADEIKPLASDDTLPTLSNVEKRSNKELFLRLPSETDERTEHILSLCRQRPAEHTVYIYYEGNKKLIRLDQNFMVDDDPTFITELKQLIGADNVKFQEKRSS